VSDAEHPEDEPRNADEEASAEQTPAETAEEPVTARIRRRTEALPASAAPTTCFIESGSELNSRPP